MLELQKKMISYICQWQTFPRDTAIQAKKIPDCIAVKYTSLLKDSLFSTRRPWKPRPEISNKISSE